MLRRIGEWVADDQTDTVRRGEVVRKLERRAMAVLNHLADHPGEVVSKDALIDAVWGGAAVSDHSVAIVISQLRRAFGDDKTAPTYIQTVPKRGYRLVASVRPAGAAEAEDATATVNAPSPRPFPLLVGPILALAALLIAAALALQVDAGRRPIIIADFSNETGSPDQDHIAFALTEIVSSRLADQHGAPVLRWRGAARPPQPKRASVLTGRVFNNNGEAFVSVQIIDTTTSEVLRGETYDLDAASFVEVAANIARDAAGDQEKAPLPPSALADDASAAAYGLYWRARYAASVREHDALRQARDVLTELIREHPAFAPGHAALADIYAHKTGEHLGLPRLDTFAEAEKHLYEARRLAGEETSETAVTAALLAFYRDRNAEEAHRLVRLATEISPGNALAWQTRGMVSSAMGRRRESLDAIARAQRLDPATPSILWDRVWFLYVAGQYEAALQAAEEAQRYSPPNPLYLALIYDALGRPADAFRQWVDRARLRGLRATLPESQGTSADYAALLAAMAAQPDYPEQDVPLALLRLKAGDTGRAIEAITTVRPPRDSWMMLWAPHIHALAPLRGDLRVGGLLSDFRELPGE